MESLAATVIHHSALPAPPFRPPPRFSRASSFNANVAGEERTIPKREEEEEEEGSE